MCAYMHVYDTHLHIVRVRACVRITVSFQTLYNIKTNTNIFNERINSGSGNTVVFGEFYGLVYTNNNSNNNNTSTGKLGGGSEKRIQQKTRGPEQTNLLCSSSSTREKHICIFIARSPATSSALYTASAAYVLVQRVYI